MIDYCIGFLPRAVSAIIPVVAAICLASPAQGDPQEDLKSVSLSVQSLKSFSVTTDVTVTYLIIQEPVNKDAPVDYSKLPAFVSRLPNPGEVIKKRASYRQMQQDGSGRIDIFDESGKTHDSIAYTPDLERVYTPRTGIGSIQPLNLTIIPDGSDYRTSFQTIFGNVSLLRFLRQRKLQQSQGFPSHLLGIHALPGEERPEVDFPGWGARIAIDPTHGGLPSIIEVYDRVGGKDRVRFRREVTGWGKLTNGLYAPTATVTEHFDLKSESQFFGKAVTRTELRVRPDGASWNTRINPTDLSLTFPVGTRITDRVRNLIYVTGKTDTGKNIDDLIEGATKIVPVTVGGAEPPPPNVLSRYWMYIAAVILVAVVVGAVRWRKLRTT